jgi:hypothetical protein
VGWAAWTSKSSVAYSQVQTGRAAILAVLYLPIGQYLFYCVLGRLEQLRRKYHVKSSLTLLFFLSLASTVNAQTQFDGRSVPCAHIAATVRSRGAVVISTGPYSYDRYVNGGQFCVRPEIAVPTWISTADAAQCFVGYICRDRAAFTGR